MIVLHKVLGFSTKLVTSLLLIHLASCNKAASPDTKQSGNGQDATADIVLSAPPPAEDPSDEAIIPPTKVMGAFLTCSEVKSDAATEETTATVRCSLLETDKSLSKLENTESWKVSGNPPPTLKIAPPDSGYHVELVYQAANQVELIHNIKNSSLELAVAEATAGTPAPPPLTASVGILVEPESRLSTVAIMKPKTLKALSSPTRFVRQLNTYGRADNRTDLANQDFFFFFQKGLAQAQCTSFESANKPGYFLRHRGSELRLDKYEADPLFKADATFCIKPSRSTKFPTGSSYQTHNVPGYYLVYNAVGKVIISSAKDQVSLDNSVFEIGEK